MNPLPIFDLLQATQGNLLGRPCVTHIKAVCTDTREMKPNSLFIALKGETHDGHDHLTKAAEAGAVLAMVQEIPANRPANLPLVVVENTRTAMGLLATHVRKQFDGCVIAVAGSNGKTGTKNLIDSVLRDSLRGTISPKSFNNDIGVPITIFPADADQDYLVLEVGTNHPGEIRHLSLMAQPDIAVITSIGAEHLEFLGDLDGVREENAHVIDGLNPSGLLIINGDDSQLKNAVAKYRGRIVTFGFNSDNDLTADQVQCDEEGVRFIFDREEFFVPLLGKHTAGNALAAIAVARHFQLNFETIHAGLARATGPQMRLQLQKTGEVTILNDAYNANPHSMKAALETVRDMSVPGRRLAILGDMRELGNTAEKYHRELGEFAAGCNIDTIVCVGPMSELTATAARAAGMARAKVLHFKSAAECAEQAKNWVRAGDLVLLKGSRGMKLETVIPALS